MAEIKFANNASSRLAGSISASSTSVSVPTSEGSLFPMLSGGDWFMATLSKLVGAVPTHEIVKVTARAGDVFTMVRGQEGTAALDFSAGDKIDNRITAGALNAKMGKAGGAFDGPVAMSDQEFTGAAMKDCGNKVGTVPAAVAGVVTIDYRNGSYQVWTPVAGAVTLVITNWPPAGINGELWIEAANLALCTVTTQVALEYLKPDGSYNTTTSVNVNQGAPLRASGIDNLMIWGRNGAPQRAKVAR